MNLQAITEDPHIARRAFLAYRDEFRKTHRAEDEALMKGYKEIAAGRQIICLPDTIKAGGVTEEGLPKLAIARADVEWAGCTVYADGGVRFTRPDLRTAWRSVKEVELPPDTLPRIRSRVEGKAMVPIIPPIHRPKFNLKNYHILWEAEWKPIPPRDPALLRLLGGGLYAVLAVWDLTPLEMKVLGMVRRAA